MQTVVELPEFLKRSGILLKDSERQDIVSHLAFNPESGVIMKGTGGVRKLRWSALGKGKSGGVRVIYYYHDEAMPLFLLTIFDKGEKANLSKGERNEVAKLTSLLVKSYGGRDE